MKRLIPLLVAVVALGVTAAVVAFAVGGDSGASTKDAGRQTTGDEAKPGVAAMCAQDHPDCNDMVVEPDGGSANMCVADAEACVDMIGEGTSRCSATAAPECEAVDGSPPIRSDEGIDPNECSLVHNIDACSQWDIARISGGETTYDITVPFNASVTGEDLKLANEIVLTFDPNASFLLQESFPPTGRATLQSDSSEFCSGIEGKLESVPSVGDVTCQPSPVDGGNSSEGDNPVSSAPSPSE